MANVTRAGHGASLVLSASVGVQRRTTCGTCRHCRCAAGAPALESFGGLPAMRQVPLSPNGKLVAMEEEQGGVRKITIFEVDGGKTRHTVAIDEANKMRSLVWADDETLLVNVSIRHS